MSKQNEHEWIDFNSWQFEKNWKKNHPLVYNYLYDIIKLEIEKQLKENYMNEDFQNKTFLPKEFKDKK